MTDYRNWTIGVGIVLIAFSLLPIRIDGPEPWLIEWTKWLAIYVGVAVSARGIWYVTDELVNLIRGVGENRRNKQ